MMIKMRIHEEAKKFLDSVDEQSRKKVFFNIRKTQQGFRGEWFEKLKGTDGIWEFRTLFNSQYIRLLAFYLKDNGGRESIIICSNGFIKKENKTPTVEIQKAESMKKIIIENS